MIQRGYAWFVGMLAATALAGCLEDRGSSGFDISENAAIQLVLETQECVTDASLTLCPADQSAATSPTPTVAPPEPTPTPGAVQRVDTSLANGASIACVRSAPEAPCLVEFTFGAVGFPPDATFLVASRLHEPATNWQLAPPPVPHDSDPDLQTVVASIELPTDVVDPRLQFAVLVFLTAPT